MRLLALDQASRITGWAIFEDNTLLQYGKFGLSQYDDIGDRLYHLRKDVKKLIEDEKIDTIALEDIYIDGQRVNNIQTFKILAEVFGVLFELCIELKKPVSAVLAGTWKSTLGIKGKTRPEQKHAAQIWVQNKFNIKPTQDEVDAICIGAHIGRKSTNDWGEE